MSAAQSFVMPTSDTPVAAAAELYALAGMPPIPLYGLTSSCECTCGNECPVRNRGKHPVGNDWQRKATLDVDAVRDRFRGHRGNIGIALALAGLVLIDADGKKGLETAASWDLPATFTQQSGSGEGAHYVYLLAPHQDGGAITDRRVAEGLDVKVRGQFVAAPSWHASGHQYTITNAIAPTVLPDEIYQRIIKQRAAPRPLPARSDAGNLYDRAQAYVARMDPAISGSGGHAATFAVARALRGWLAKGLPEAHCLAILDEYNARCEPPWSDRELAHKWESSADANTVPELADRPRLVAISGGRAAASVRSVATNDNTTTPPTPPGPPGRGEPDWRSELLWAEGKNGKDKLVIHSENVIRILQLHQDWIGKIGFDEFRARIVVSAEAPWNKYQRPNRTLTTWTDNDTTRLAGWMRANFHRWAFSPSITDCERAVAVVARTHDFNPVRDYLENVRALWDGTPRLSRWTTTYLGAEDTEYHRLVGAWWLISAAARVYAPGCKVDTVPILEGRQGLRKSSALRVLAGAEFFNDTPIDLNSKDAYTAIQGCWFVELAELDSLMRVEASRAKAFFSSGKDRFRAAYARHETDELRQCIFVGTVNHGEYLNDPTGARRFWPIGCQAIDLDALDRDRDQLWAEAAHEYHEGKPWYPQTAHEESLLEGTQDTRTKRDAWEKRIADYLGKKRQTSVEDLLTNALNLEPRDWTPAAQTRVGVIVISKLGWMKRRVRVGTRSEWLYEAPEQAT